MPAVYLYANPSDLAAISGEVVRRMRDLTGLLVRPVSRDGVDRWYAVEQLVDPLPAGILQLASPELFSPEHMRALEDLFVDVALTLDPAALLWDGQTRTLHNKDYPACDSFVGKSVPFAGLMRHELEFVFSLPSRRCAAGDWLRVLAEQFPAASPYKFGEYEPRRRFDRARNDFAALWESERDLSWTSKAGWIAYAGGLTGGPGVGPLGVLKLETEALVDPLTFESPIDTGVMVTMAEALGAQVTRTRWAPDSSDGASFMAIGGMWFGFDQTPTVAVHLASAAAADLAGSFIEADGWRVENLSGGAVVFARTDPAPVPPSLQGVSVPHLLCARVRPRSLLMRGPERAG